MKQLLINTIFLTLLAAGFSSCKKTIKDDYLNPETPTTGSMGKLLTGMFLNPRIHPSYYDYATFVLPTTAAFSQLTALAPGTQMYVPTISYDESRWNHYYNGSMPTDPTQTPDYNYDGPGILNSYREMQTTYAALSASEQARQYVFLQCAKVILYDQTAQMIDLWGDIPFSKANSLNTASRSISFVPFDNAAAIYDTLITGLKDLNNYFDTTKVATEITASLKKQDILLGGDITWWRRYVNSLRLRLLMRISYQDETTAKTEVSAMLADPTTYPLITANTYNVTLKMSGLTLKSDLKDALTGSPFAPAYLLDTLMLANSDPRTAVLWDSAAGSNYKGFPSNGTVSDYDGGKGVYATYDTVTFMYNYNVPGVLFTAAEISFLTAEANERWGAGSTPAATAYATGIHQSTDFYYGINQSTNLSTGSWSTLPSPASTAVDAYIANVAYAGTTAQKLEKIATQNWINFFILQAGQAWAEVRRTGYPVLPFFTASNGAAPLPPTRLLYPSGEQLYNAGNYAAVSAKDTRNTKIFWQVK
jgi:hypothetical protein